MRNLPQKSCITLTSSPLVMEKKLQFGFFLTKCLPICILFSFICKTCFKVKLLSREAVCFQFPWNFIIYCTYIVIYMKYVLKQPNIFPVQNLHASNKIMSFTFWCLFVSEYFVVPLKQEKYFWSFSPFLPNIFSHTFVYRSTYTQVCTRVYTIPCYSQSEQYIFE